MLGTATITGILYGTDGAPVKYADVHIVPRQKYLASVDGAAWVPRAVTVNTDGTGAIGILVETESSGSFTPGLTLGLGQYDISVRKDGTSHNGVLTIDAGMIAAPGPVDINLALQPAPAPELVSEVLTARDTVLQTAQQVSDDVATIQGFVPVVVTLVGLTETTATFEVQQWP